MRLLLLAYFDEKEELMFHYVEDSRRLWLFLLHVPTYSSQDLAAAHSYVRLSNPPDEHSLSLGTGFYARVHAKSSDRRGHERAGQSKSLKHRESLIVAEVLGGIELESWTRKNTHRAKRKPGSVHTCFLTHTHTHTETDIRSLTFGPGPVNEKGFKLS